MGSGTQAPEWSAEEQALVEELRKRWEDRQSGWEADADNQRLNEAGLWHHMPEIDSKEVARLLDVFGKHLGTDADPDMIRDGGYDTVEEIVEDILPQVRAKEEENEAAADNPS